MKQNSAINCFYGKTKFLHKTVEIKSLKRCYETKVSVYRYNIVLKHFENWTGTTQRFERINALQVKHKKLTWNCENKCFFLKIRCHSFAIKETGKFNKSCRKAAKIAVMKQCKYCISKGLENCFTQRIWKIQMRFLSIHANL